MVKTMRLAGKSKKALPKRIAFTIEALKAETCPPGKKRVYVYDSNTPLALCITRSGLKTFYLCGRVKGKASPQRVRIGKFPDLAIEQARKIVKQLVGGVAGGADPMKEKREQRTKQMSLGDLWDWFLESHAKLRKRSWKDDESRWKTWVKVWSARRLTDITMIDVAALHRRVKEESSNATANRVLALLSKMFNAARQLGFEGANPCKGVEHFAEQSRERYLRGAEMQAFFIALDDEATDADWRDFFKMALWTGARRNNLYSMCWAEIDMGAARWTIPGKKFKNGVATTVYLPDPAMDILTRRMSDEAAKAVKYSREPRPWVFPTRRSGSSGHMIQHEHAWTDLCKRAKLTDLHLHDLRRTLGSWQAGGGTALNIIGKSLGHRSLAATAVYARLDLDPVKRSVDMATNAMLVEAAKGKTQEPAEVKS